jgi:hypothetical protein
VPAAIGGPSLEQAQERIVALRQAEALHQPFRRPSSGGMGEQTGQVADTARAAGEWICNLRREGDEGFPLTEGIATSPSCDLEVKRNASPLDRQILQTSDIPAVTATGRRFAAWTAPGSRRRGANEPACLRLLDVQNLNARSGRPLRLCFHPASTHRTCHQNKRSASLVAGDNIHTD